ncbi:efflux RND transporter periplasmic adaptor subunit [Ignavibacteria bacterium 4148-Me]|uniref:efflux RND transporter periplasmic adaptor subunit n=1 Tax=Rosettibacter primus TaxID=3111523 RepID=UPI00336C25B0
MLIKKLRTEFIAAIIFVAVIFVGCGDNKTENTESEMKEKESHEVSEVVLSSEARSKIDLAFDEVKEGTISGMLKAPAKVITNQDYEAQVSSLVQGRVLEVYVKEGDYVKEGQILMHVEGLEIGEIIADYLQAKAMLDFTKAAYERQQTLLEQNVGSQKSFLESKAEYEKALAEYNAEDKRIHSIGLEHSDIETSKDSEHIAGVLPIKAPIGGIIVERNVVIGQLVEANTTAFKIMNISNLWAEGQIYEKDLTKVTGKPKVEFTTPAYPNEKFKGEVILIGQTIDEHSRTIKVRASLQNTNGKLKPNMFGELFIPISSNTKGIIVPTDAIVKEGNESYVFVVENDSTFSRRNVETGIEFAGMREVVSGIKKGEKIVTKGVFFLKSELLKETFGEEE